MSGQDKYSGRTNVQVGQMSGQDKCPGRTNIRVGQMSRQDKCLGRKNVRVGQMSRQSKCPCRTNVQVDICPGPWEETRCGVTLLLTYQPSTQGAIMTLIGDGPDNCHPDTPGCTWKISHNLKKIVHFWAQKEKEGMREKKCHCCAIFFASFESISCIFINSH